MNPRNKKNRSLTSSAELDSHLHVSESLHSSFSKQHSHRSLYCSSSSSFGSFNDDFVAQASQQPQLKSGFLTHESILYASLANSNPNTIEVALSTHHPPCHSLNTSDPTKRTRVIWIHDREQTASPAIVLLLSARAKYRLGR